MKQALRTITGLRVLLGKAVAISLIASLCAVGTIEAQRQRGEPAPRQRGLPAPKNEDPGASSVVHVIARSERGDTLLHATGVVVNDSGLVVAYGHLFTPDMYLTVVDQQGRAYAPWGPITRDTVIGVITMQALGIRSPSARMATGLPLANQQLRVITPRFRLPALSVDATVVRVETYRSGPLARVMAGNDQLMVGAPMFNAQGELVALGYSTDDRGAATHYGVPSVTFRRLVENWRTRVVAGAGADSTRSSTMPRSGGVKVPAATIRTVALKRNQLNVAGLMNAELLTRMYSGEFEKITGERVSGDFAGFFQSYLEVRATICRGAPQSRQAELTEVYRQLEREIEADSRRQAVGTTVNPNREEELLSIVVSQLSLSQDFPKFVELNPCNGAPIRQFEQNLMLFARGKPSIRLASADNPGATPFRESDYAWLADELIAAAAKGWALNKYVLESAVGVTVTQRDALGRPASVRGSYRYESLLGRLAATFELTFGDGVPECLFFSDATMTCRSVNRQLAYKYLMGRYWLK